MFVFSGVHRAAERVGHRPQLGLVAGHGTAVGLLGGHLHSHAFSLGSLRALAEPFSRYDMCRGAVHLVGAARRSRHAVAVGGIRGGTAPRQPLPGDPRSVAPRGYASLAWPGLLTVRRASAADALDADAEGFLGTVPGGKVRGSLRPASGPRHGGRGALINGLERRAEWRSARNPSAPDGVVHCGGSPRPIGLTRKPRGFGQGTVSSSVSGGRGAFRIIDRVLERGRIVALQGLSMRTHHIEDSDHELCPPSPREARSASDRLGNLTRIPPDPPVRPNAPDAPLAARPSHSR